MALSGYARYSEGSLYTAYVLRDILQNKLQLEWQRLQINPDGGESWLWLVTIITTLLELF